METHGHRSTWCCLDRGAALTTARRRTRAAAATLRLGGGERLRRPDRPPTRRGRRRLPPPRRAPRRQSRTGRHCDEPQGGGPTQARPAPTARALPPRAAGAPVVQAVAVATRLGRDPRPQRPPSHTRGGAAASGGSGHRGGGCGRGSAWARATAGGAKPERAPRGGRRPLGGLDGGGERRRVTCTSHAGPERPRCAPQGPSNAPPRVVHWPESAPSWSRPPAVACQRQLPQESPIGPHQLTSGTKAHWIDCSMEPDDPTRTRIGRPPNTGAKSACSRDSAARD